MTSHVILADHIVNTIHDVFAGEHFTLPSNPMREEPYLNIVSPWIYNVVIKGKVPKMGPMSPQISYSFESIDLAHAILLARLLFECTVFLVTKAPDSNTYGNPAVLKEVRTMLDFLDEVGCRIFTNNNLHSKLITTDRIAIIGSMNVTKSALYDREEIAVSLDDLENLSILNDYCRDIIAESAPYGYTASTCLKNRFGLLLTPSLREILTYADLKITRGLLYEVAGGTFRRTVRRHDFSLEELLMNLESFYLETITELIITHESSPYDSKHEALAFIKRVLGRKSFPNLPPKYKSVQFDSDRYLKEWELRHLKKSTRQR